MQPDTSFGEWVRRRRKALDLTQEKLADLVGCSYSAIRKIESDERRPSVQVAELLASHLKIDDEQQTRFLQVARGYLIADKLPGSSSGIQLDITTKTFIPPTNLPAPSTPFIGRVQDIASLTKLIQDPLCRLITLLGQGGMGKTRLAIQVAAQSLDSFDGRAYFVQLAPLTSVDAIVPAIASVFGVTAQNMDLKTRLVGYLREKRILLVLDNFEHLIQGADLLSELVTQAPQLKLLVTSRERLNLQGEWTLELSGLTTPPETQSNAGAYDAPELFEQSVKRVRPEIQFSDEDRVSITHICNLVEGLPLAIELAAAWINVLSLSEIAHEIKRSFDFLKTSQRNIPERHKSLRAVFEHSWQLLEDDERFALSRLSVFQGGFSREAAESVAGASLDTLTSLLAKSLIRRAENGRFDMHEAIRQYSAEYLEDEHDLREKHSRFYLSLLKDLEKLLQGADPLSAVQTLASALSNIHIALHWGVDNKLYKEMHEVFLPFWAAYDLRGRTRDGFLITEKLVEALRSEPLTDESKIWLARALTYHGMFCYRSGDFPRGRVVIDEVIEMLRPMNKPEYLIEPLIYSTIIYTLTGSLSEAQKQVDEGVALAKEYDNKWFVAVGTFNQGTVARFQGDLKRATPLLKEALALWREMGSPPRLTGLALSHLSTIAIQLDVRDEAREYLAEGLKLASKIFDRWGMGSALTGYGRLALREDDAFAAENYIQQSIAVFTELGARADLAEALTVLGKLHLYRSEFLEAQEVLKKAIRLGLESNTMPQVYEASVEFADCLLNLDQKEDASAIMRARPVSTIKVESLRKRAEEVIEEVGGKSTLSGDEKKINDVLAGLLG